MTDIVIQRISNTEYSFKLSSREGIRHVAKALTFINPDPFAYTRRIEKFDKRRLTFKIGMLRTLERYVREHDVTYTKTDYDYRLPDGVTVDDRLTGRYDHQRQAVEAFFRSRFGIIVVPTRGGKTFIASEILRIFLTTDTGNFLFVVDNTTLHTQAVSDIKRFFERYGGIEVGEIKAGEIDVTKRVTVGMIQTIQAALSGRGGKEKKTVVEKYLKELRFLCVDEVHENCSDSRLKIYKKCRKLEYQLCLSATPYRSGTLVQNLKLKEWSGDIIYRITEKKLRKRGVLSEYQVFLLSVDHERLPYNLQVSDYREYLKALIYDSGWRNGILESVILLMKELRLKTLVLFQSIEHGRMISELTGERFISGITSSMERERAKAEFLGGDGKVLLASDIFKKGVTLPEVQVLIIADDCLETATTIQRKGRVLGTTERKTRSLVIDFIDIFQAYFSTHSEARLDVYVKSIGERNVKILDALSDDYIETLRKWTVKWFASDNGCSVLQ